MVHRRWKHIFGESRCMRHTSQSSLSLDSIMYSTIVYPFTDLNVSNAYLWSLMQTSCSVPDSSSSVIHGRHAWRLWIISYVPLISTRICSSTVGCYQWEQWSALFLWKNMDNTVHVASKLMHNKRTKANGRSLLRTLMGSARNRY